MNFVENPSKILKLKKSQNKNENAGGVRALLQHRSGPHPFPEEQDLGGGGKMRPAANVWKTQ